jgi:hypothetical protein
MFQQRGLVHPHLLRHLAGIDLPRMIEIATAGGTRQDLFSQEGQDIEISGNPGDIIAEGEDLMPLSLLRSMFPRVVALEKSFIIAIAGIPGSSEG